MKARAFTVPDLAPAPSAADAARAAQLNMASVPVSPEMARMIGAPNDAVRGSMFDKINAGMRSSRWVTLAYWAFLRVL